METESLQDMYTYHMKRSWSKLSSGHLRVYTKNLFFIGIQSFDSLIRIGKELECGIQSGRITNTKTPLQDLKNSLDERNEDASTYIPPKKRNQNIEQIHLIF